MRRRASAAPKADRQKTKALDAVAKRFGAFRPAVEVLKIVRAVPTRFVQFDHGARVGGWPLERFTLVHGKSNEGKTLFVLGLLDSFLAANHFAMLIDAERTTPMTWVQQLIGEERAAHPRFYAERPDTYEATIALVRNFLNTLIAAREAGDVPPETSAIIVVDSLRKLVPADMMAEILKEVKESAVSGIKAGRDRRAQIQAKMNAAWMDELVPLLEKAGAAFVAIAREMVDPDNQNSWAIKAGSNYKVGGGGAIYYDASLVVRVERDNWVARKFTVDGKDQREIYGERHLLTIRKTKIGGKEDKVVRCAFHSSNGVLVPFGFDRARDVLELAMRFGIVTKPKPPKPKDGEAKKQKGGGGAGWLQWGRHKWQGDHAAVKKLAGDVALLAELEAAVRAKFEEVAPLMIEEETGEVIE